MKSEFEDKCSWVARKDFTVSSFHDGKRSYFVCLEDRAFTPSEAKLLIKEINQHIKRIEDFKKAKRK